MESFIEGMLTVEAMFAGFLILFFMHARFQGLKNAEQVGLLQQQVELLKHQTELLEQQSELLVKLRHSDADSGLESSFQSFSDRLLWLLQFDEGEYLLTREDRARHAVMAALSGNEPSGVSVVNAVKEYRCIMRCGLSEAYEFVKNMKKLESLDP